MPTLARTKRGHTRQFRAGIHRPGHDIFRPCTAFRRWRRHADLRIAAAGVVLAQRWCAGCGEVEP
jgi:hypothetical protein